MGGGGGGLQSLPWAAAAAEGQKVGHGSPVKYSSSRVVSLYHPYGGDYDFDYEIEVEVDDREQMLLLLLGIRRS